MKENLILQLKNKIFGVSKNEDGTLVLTGSDGKIIENAGAIIGSIGGIDATLLRCYKTTETVVEIANRQRQASDILRSKLIENRNLIAEKGTRIDLGEVKFAKLDGKFFKHYHLHGWKEITEEQYLIVKERYDAKTSKVTKEYNTLIASSKDGIIETTYDNLALVLKYLNTQNYGSLQLPQMSITYSVNQYDCDGKTATTIVLDSPISDEIRSIENETMFQFGAPTGHLQKYRKIRL